MTHTKKPSWTEDHFRKLFDTGKDGEERLEAVRQWSERNRVCTQAMHGVEDPEAFMRDVKHLLVSPTVSWVARVNQHLKGGE